MNFVAAQRKTPQTGEGMKRGFSVHVCNCESNCVRLTLCISQVNPNTFSLTSHNPGSFWLDTFGCKSMGAGSGVGIIAPADQKKPRRRHSKGRRLKTDELIPSDSPKLPCLLHSRGVGGFIPQNLNPRIAQSLQCFKGFKEY